jgi:signal transduction histidine kinase
MLKTQILDYLVKNKFFEHIDREDIMQLDEQLFAYKQFAKGDTLVKENTISEELYLIISGEVKVTKKFPSGEESEIARRTANEYVGELSLMQDENRSANMYCLSEVEIIVINKDNFLLLINEFPVIGSNLSHTIAARLTESDNKTIQEMEKYETLLSLHKEIYNQKKELERVNLIRRKAEETLQRSNEQLKILHKKLEEKVNNAIAEIREKDLQLIQQSRQAGIGEMIGFIAHQWRQPLNAIAVIVQNMEDAFNYGELDDQKIKSDTINVLDQVNFMSRTIDDFRNFFKPDKLMTDFNLKENIERVIRFVKNSYKTNNIRLNLDLDESCSANGFPREYSQVILNILNNARDAFEEKKIPSDEREVKIKLFKLNDNNVVTISDSARGIPENIIDNIFESYFTTKSEDKGTGLGLYMSKTIIEENMKGKLTVSNIKDGAEFRIEV